MLPTVRRLLAAALLVIATRTPAQQLIGSVVQSDGRSPAAGVIVTARDTAGLAVAQAVTNSQGRFVLFVDAGAPTALRLERTGFAPTDVPPRTLAADEVAEVVLTLRAEPVRVPALRRGATTCGRGRADDRAVVDVVLEEARKAFVAAQGAMGREDLAARFATIEHRTAKNGEDTLRTVMRRGHGALPSLFPAVTTDELEAGGFFATIAGERVFRAPEPALLASAWFTATHCFTLRPQGDSALRVEFRPARERRGLVDLGGAYVMDPRTLALRRVEFRYDGMREEERHADAGGTLEFAQLVTGDWVVTRWWQRFPLLGYRASDGATTFVRTSLTLIDIIGHRVTGGRLLAVARGDAPLWRTDPVEGAAARTEFGRACAERLGRSNTGAVRGRLVPADSEPVGGRLVRAHFEEPVVVDRTQLTQREHVREAVTGPDGTFLICDIPARREATLRWEIRGQEQRMPFTLPAAGEVLTVSPPPAP